MTVAVVVLAVVALAALAYLVGERVVDASTVVRRRVVVNMADGRAFKGVLMSRRRRLLLLRDTEMFEGSAEPVKLDGVVVVERSQVDFVQAPGGE